MRGVRKCIEDEHPGFGVQWTPRTQELDAGCICAMERSGRMEMMDAIEFRMRGAILMWGHASNTSVW